MKKSVWIILFILLLYTRTVGLDWGLPFPFHPDERNMTDAVLNLKCNISSFKLHTAWFKTCFNPHFFAYGQFNLYLGYLLQWPIHIVFNSLNGFRFDETVLALRLISVFSSILNGFLIYKILHLFNGKFGWFKDKREVFIFQILTWLIIILTPYFIQYAHFGTTESILMLFYTTLSYLGLKVACEKQVNKTDLIFFAVTCGLSIATKVSSIIFLGIPILSLFIKALNKKTKYRRYEKILLAKIMALLRLLPYLMIFLGLTFIFSAIFSVQSLLNWPDFINTIKYEVAVGNGSQQIFYTRSFFLSLPVLFQLTKIFPYVLGLIPFILFVSGFLLLPWKIREFVILRLFFLLYFLPTAFLYAKWTRFLSPVFPLATLIFIITFIEFYIYIKKRLLHSRLVFVSFIFLVFLSVLPGLSYLSIYQQPDVRFLASKWIYENIPAGSKILSETANVMDIPINIQSHKFKDVIPRQYNIVSFNFYDLDGNPQLQSELDQHLQTADYIFIPSRRVNLNHSCFNDQASMINKSLIGYSLVRCSVLEKRYPKLNNYYKKLFSGELGFVQIAEINSYPKISLFGKTIIEFPDESAEETWTVFDHPVIRIFKKNSEY